MPIGRYGSDTRGSVPAEVGDSRYDYGLGYAGPPYQDEHQYNRRGDDSALPAIQEDQTWSSWSPLQALLSEVSHLSRDWTGFLSELSASMKDLPLASLVDFTPEHAKSAEQKEKGEYLWKQLLKPEGELMEGYLLDELDELDQQQLEQGCTHFHHKRVRRRRRRVQEEDEEAGPRGRRPKESGEARRVR